MNMYLIDWLIVIGFLVTLFLAALSTRKFAKSVSGFLAAERSGGRYLISVANSISGVGLITVVYLFQIHYDNGFTGQWWSFLSAPVGIILAVTGWVVFRFRQTRALTMAQFFEMRYSRSFRVFAGLVAFFSGILNFGIFPSIGARFFINLCQFPETFTLPGMEWAISTYAFIMAMLLIISVIFTFLGGQIAIMFTDFLQGTFSYIAFLVVICFLFYAFSKTQLMETALAAAPGHSLVNPFDLGKEENFNSTYYLISFALGFYTILAWQGNAGYNCAAKNAHEAKMSNICGSWRLLAVLPVLYVLAPLVIHAYTEHADFRDDARLANHSLKIAVDTRLAELGHADPSRAADYELLSDMSFERSEQLMRLTEKDRGEVTAADFAEITELESMDPETVRQLGHLLKDKTAEVASQARLPLVLGRVLPKGLMGLFCAALLAAFISTHNTYLHSWGAILIQDVILPFRKTHLKPKTHLLLLRLSILGVAVYIFFFSLYFQHSQRIIMYTTITWSIFVSGAGAVIIGGLYWKRGTTAAAWTTMFAGVTLSLLGVVVSQSGPSAIHAARTQAGWESVTSVLAKIRCDEAFWRAAEWLFSLNAQVILFLICGTCIFLYVTVSLLGRGKPFNMDKLLHRGEYKLADDTSADILEAGSIWQKLGFTKDFTKGDTFLGIITLAWPLFWLAVFAIGTLIRKRISDHQWFEFWYGWLWFMLALGVVVTIWFAIGGFRDLRDFFKRLNQLDADALDDGQVEKKQD